MNEWWNMLVAIGVPSLLLSFLSRKFEKRIDEREAKRDRKADEREGKRIKLETQLIQLVNASIALGEATARAVQRIPDAHCNGDMHKALDYAANVKHETKNFLVNAGVESLYDE